MDEFTAQLRKTETKRVESDSCSFVAVLDERGRIIIPASIRKRLFLKFGSRFLVSINGIYISDKNLKGDKN